MSISLQNNILSVQDLKSAILEIRSYTRWFSQESVKKRFSKTEQSQGPVISESATGTILQWHQDKEVSQESLDQLIESLEEYARTAHSITITLAAPASVNLKKDLANWCRQNIKPDILVDFKFNSTMLGGMSLKYGSHIFDWSFKRQILENRQKFPEILRNV